MESTEETPARLLSIRQEYGSSFESSPISLFSACVQLLALGFSGMGQTFIFESFKL
jgi:hypothetical protein